MRYSNLLPLTAALATAVVIPDDVTAQQLSLEVNKAAENAEKTIHESWDAIRPVAQQHGAEVKESVDEVIHDWWDYMRMKSEETVDFVNQKAHWLLDDILDHDAQFPLDAEDAEYAIGISGHPGEPGHGHPPGHPPGQQPPPPPPPPPPGHPPHHPPGRRPPPPPPGHHPHHHGDTNLTVYQSIQASNYTTKFAALVNDFPDIVDLLNSTEANVTVFVPLDRAFDKIPEHHGKPPKEFIEKIIQYHILPGYYPFGRIAASHTLATALKDPALGGRPQRLRASIGIFGLRINFYSKVGFANLYAKNGIIHGVSSILVPPPPARRLISLFPSKFSTLELAAEKTGLFHHKKPEDGKEGDDKDDHKHHPRLTGLTVFAPTNLAFRRLGPAANAFLFNTEKGLGYLRALLKYHVVANQTLYSDAFYGIEGSSEDLFSSPEEGSEEQQNSKGKGNGHFHIDLPTLLEEKHLSIDIARWLGFISMRINGYKSVAVQDSITLDGVVHVVSSVLIPPREPGGKKAWTVEDGNISVEELIERLNPYVENNGEGEKENAGAGEEPAWGEL